MERNEGRKIEYFIVLHPWVLPFFGNPKENHRANCLDIICQTPDYSKYNLADAGCEMAVLECGYLEKTLELELSSLLKGQAQNAARGLLHKVHHQTIIF